MKFILFLFFPLILFCQQKEDWASTMKTAMNDIDNQDYVNAIKNLDASLKFSPNNPSSLYFKGYLQIIIGEKDKGCENLIEALYYNSNQSKKLYAKKCIDFDPKLNPEKFKSGKFTLQVLGDSQLYNFERKEDIQYETYSGQTYSGKINWLKNGDYTIIPSEKTKMMLGDSPSYVVRILKINGNEYLYEKIVENQVQFGKINKIE